MTTTSKAAGNGSVTTAKAEDRPDRLTGMAQVREAETYHDSSVMNDALFEAQRLADRIHRAVSTAYFDNRNAVESVSSPEIRDLAEEALNCVHTAKVYLHRLLSNEPPF